MDSQNKIFVTVIVVVSLVVLAILLQPAVEDRLAPQPKAAWVAIEVDRRGVADVGPAVLEVGTPFRLHAVLEAEGRGGEPVYYTEAPGLSFFGSPAVPAASLRPWERQRPVKIRWFTLEGERPFVELDPETGIAGFRVEPFLRSDWPLAWSIPGEIDAANDNHLERGEALDRQLFGSQWYHVRVELYDRENDLVPARVIRSWDVADMRPNAGRFPWVSLGLPGVAGPASRVFGLTQLEPPAAADPELLRQIDELARHGVAFSRLTVLRDQVRQTGKHFFELTWRIVNLEGEARWGQKAAAGDLLRVGDRVVVLYQDRGKAGVVDHADLCFDFVQGALVRTLEDVFGAGTDQAVELASLHE